MKWTRLLQDKLRRTENKREGEDPKKEIEEDQYEKTD